MHLLMTIGAGLIVLGVGVMLLVMFTAKPEPEDDEKNRGKVISFVDEKG